MAILDQVCSELGPFESECSSWVQQNIDATYEALEDPNKTCITLEACPSDSLRAKKTHSQLKRIWSSNNLKMKRIVNRFKGFINEINTHQQNNVHNVQDDFDCSFCKLMNGFEK